MGIVRAIKNFFTGKPDTVGRIQMVTETGEGLYVWDGKMYQSDIIRACIRPKTQAVGKIVGKHIRETATKDGKTITVNPEPYIRQCHLVSIFRCHAQIAWHYFFVIF